MSSKSKRRVSYYYDSDVGHFSYGWNHPMKPHRMRMTHSLLTAYDMLPKMDVIRPRRATPFQMTRFHTDEYIDFLSRVTPETSQEMSGGGTRYFTVIVGEDNPPFDGLFEFCSISAGGSISAAERLNSGAADIAINWAGGLHHAKKREASGFCYINDIVLGILELLRYHTRVLYIDIDVHHGDGVEEAFYTTDRVLTCSFHKQRDFFPGSGKVEDKGLGKGKGYAVNVPLLNGVTDENYKSLFEPIIHHILEWYRPGAVVLQCGADSLSGDKLGPFNISMNGHADCVRFLRQANIPLILLGGGGYTPKNVACAWTYETAVALGTENELDLNLPYNEYLEWYGPRYRLEVEASNMFNENQERSYLDILKHDVFRNLKELNFAPSVAMQEVPRVSVAKEMKLPANDDEDDVYHSDEMSDLDQKLLNRVTEVFGVNSEKSYSDDEEVAAGPAGQRHRRNRDRYDSEEEMSSADEQSSRFVGRTTRNGKNALYQARRQLLAGSKRPKRYFFRGSGFGPQSRDEEDDEEDDDEEGSEGEDEDVETVDVVMNDDDEEEERGRGRKGKKLEEELDDDVSVLDMAPGVVRPADGPIPEGLLKTLSPWWSPTS